MSNAVFFPACEDGVELIIERGLFKWLRGCAMPNSSSTNHALKPQERYIVWLLAMLGAVHVMIFSAAFPFFNNVDEPIHFDLVLKYSHGQVPRKMDMLSAESAAYLSLFNSCAYLGTPDMFPGNQMPPPPWAEPVKQMQQDFVVNSAAWQQQQNYEVSEPPLYYAMAGIWWKIGRGIGFHDGRLLYWLRFLNILQIIGLVWLAWYAARLVFLDKLFLRLGPPMLIAFMPQTAFYSLGNDMLSSVCFGATFICLLRWQASDKPSGWLGAITGLAMAATWLCKATNLPLLMVAMAAVYFKTWQLFPRMKWRATLPMLTFICCAFPPIAAWAVWCKLNFGDLTGANIKTTHLGWTVKPFSEWWHHPIFTPAGLWTYLSGQLGTFWQGEFDWHAQPLALPGNNFIFTALSLVLPAVALFSLFRSKFSPEQKNALWLSLAECFVALSFFGLMSMVYDFHNCPNPSRDHPYFQAGRMILGMLIPFLLLLVYGLDRVLARGKERTKFLVLGVLITMMLASEVITDYPVFSNEYNWFHLP
jgi:hypothetical protein